MSADENALGNTSEILEDISSLGDIIFNVGAKEPAHKLRVSSAVLSMTSTAFAGLLNPRFAEGSRQRDSASPAEIDLPDDDPTAISDLCHLLHLKPVPDLLRTPEALRTTHTKRILGLAAAADKYCCSDVLSLQLRALLQTAMERHHAKDTEESRQTRSCLALVDIAAAAYLTNQAIIFHDATRALAWCHGKSFSQFRNRGGLPTDVLLILEEMRSRSWWRIADHLAALGVRLCQNCMAFNEDRGWTIHVRKVFKGSWWPRNFHFWETSLRECVEMIRDLDTYESSETPTSRCCPVPSYGSNKLKVHQSQLVELAQQIERRCFGLCLRCLREDSIEPDKPCRKQEHIPFAQ